MKFSELLKSVNDIKEPFPPVNLWNPDLCQDVEMRIDRDGNWYYQNSIIGRDKLKIIFSRILKHENGKYFLVTPVEKVLVNVDIAPYMIIDYEIDPTFKNIILKTNLDYSFSLDVDHPLKIKSLNNETIPIVKVRDNLEGFLSRSVFYGLIDVALKQEQPKSNTSNLILRSFDQEFSLGSIN